MSSRNTLKNKANRRASRGENFPRTPASEPIPVAIATKILTNPLYKVSSKVRRKLQARRSVVVEVERTPANHPAVKLALRLQKLGLTSLFRLLKKSARRASTCKNLLSELSPGSHFAPPIEAQHTHELGVFKQVKAEIQSRK